MVIFLHLHQVNHLYLNLNHIIKIPLAVAGYIACILLYLFLGTRSDIWTVFWCCYEKLGTCLFLYLLTQKNKPTFIDRLFLQFAIAVNIVMSGMYIVTLISDRLSIIQWFYYLQFVILAGIISLIVWFVFIFTRDRTHLE